MNMGSIIADIIETIPRGQAFDENDVIAQLLKLHRSTYLTFIEGYAHTKKPMELAAAAIAGEIEKFEGIFVEKQESKPIPASLASVSYECTVWKRI